MYEYIQPEIIDKESFYVIGLKYIGDNRHNELNSLWDNFLKRVCEIKTYINDSIHLGILDFSSKANKGNIFTYMPCIEVENLNTIPAGMHCKTIPTNKYAVFCHPNPLEPIGKTYEYIYGTWLPNSEYVHGNAPDFEMYIKSTNNLHITEKLHIYVPIKDR